MRAAGERLGAPGLAPAAAVGALCFGALFFADASDTARLAWIGAGALALAAVPLAAALAGIAPAVRLDRHAAAFAGGLLGLAFWMGLSTLWSLSPDRSWTYTNRTLVYAAFALAGIVLGAWLPKPALGAARAAVVLLGLLYGWALLAKCVPAFYGDYGRVARLRVPLGYWNELALLGAAGVPVALRLAARRRGSPERAAGTALLYAAALVTLLTYSRVGVVLAALAAVAWVVLSSDRVESLAAVALGGGAAAAAFGIALALPGITSDGQPRSVRATDGAIFAAVVLVGALLAAGGAAALARLEARRPLGPARRRAIERAAAAAAVVAAAGAVAVSAAFAHRIWSEFANPVSSQIGSGSTHLASVSSSNRWRWWQEEWQAFLDHPGLGTGAGTFHLTDLRLRTSSVVTTDEPHNTPLQFLGELGIPGLLLYLGVVATAVAGIVAARRRAAGEERAAVTALGLALAVFGLHTVVDMDWSYLATCGPLLLGAGVLLGRPATARTEAPPRRRLVAAAAVLVGLGGVYSLAAPWLAQRTLASATTIAQVKRAHAYDPLSTDALTEWAALVDAHGQTLRALELYKQAVALEPESSDVWYALGSFYYQHGAWPQAYDALSKAWKYDPYGPAGQPCGLLDQARHKALGVWPASCPRGSPRAASP